MIKCWDFLEKISKRTLGAIYKNIYKQTKPTHYFGLLKKTTLAQKITNNWILYSLVPPCAAQTAGEQTNSLTVSGLGFASPLQFSKFFLRVYCVLLLFCPGWCSVVVLWLVAFVPWCVLICSSCRLDPARSLFAFCLSHLLLATLLNVLRNNF